jgi:putative ABC transport system ATP-binding protein
VSAAPAVSADVASPAGAEPAVALRDVRFAYRRGVDVLRVERLDVRRGERVFVFGPSGSGKTTLLGLLAGVLRATSGSVQVLGRDLARLGGAERDAFRAEHVGYVFQMFNLIPYLSVRENVTLPARLSAGRRARLGGRSPDAAAEHLAAELEIAELLDERVTSLSVGQQQRVAAARALLGAPELVIADEPTSALDADRRERFLELLFQVCAEAGSTLIFVSHDRGLEPMFDRAVSLPELNGAGRRGVNGGARST